MGRRLVRTRDVLGAFAAYWKRALSGPPGFANHTVHTPNVQRHILDFDIVWSIGTAKHFKEVELVVVRTAQFGIIGNMVELLFILSY